MSDDLVAFLRARLDEDKAVAAADDRHWSEVPHRLFSRRHILPDIAAKRAAVEALHRCTDHGWTGTWAVVTVARDALRQIAQVYADHPDYQQEWKP